MGRHPEGARQRKHVLPAVRRVAGGRGLRDGQVGIGKKPGRWVVERTNSWRNNFRALRIRWEKTSANYLAFVHPACALIRIQAANQEPRESEREGTPAAKRASDHGAKSSQRRS